MKRKLFAAVVCVLILGVLAPPTIAVAPSNDDFDNATVISALPFTDDLDTSAATYAGDDPWDCSNHGSVWYAFTPAADMLIEANTYGSDYDTVLSAYTGSRGALSMVPGACNDDYNGLQSRIHFAASAGMTYYFLVAYCCGGGGGGDGGGHLVLNVQEITAPDNDLFANAILVESLPFQHAVDVSGATLESGEQLPSCCGDALTGSVWYAYTPGQGGSISARADAWFSHAVSAYTGDSVSSLSEVGSRCSWEWLTLYVEAGTTYYFQVGGMYSEGGPITFYLDVPPPPVADFWFYPDNPSAFDNIWFENYSWDPGGLGFTSQTWDFGDGTSSTEWSTSHRYAADGDYAVQLGVTTADGRSASTTKTAHVRTHDVAITSFKVPNAASSGQTRQIVVGLNSKRYPERVEVQLFRSVPGGFEWVGTLTQSVPVRPSNRTTDFNFSYTFTGDDAAIGKVTFRAVAYVLDAWDALPADNEAIAAPTKVNR